MIKKQNGITLIALVITIIVLIILAGVSLSLTTGDNGVLSKAKIAREETRVGQIKDIRDIWFSDTQIAVETDTEDESLDKILERLSELLTDEETQSIIYKREVKIGEQDISFNYYTKEIGETLNYFKFDKSTGTLTSREEVIGTYQDRNISLKIAVFPKEIEGVPVKKIVSSQGIGLLANIQDLEKVIILSDIDTIGDWDFYNCKNLKSIEFPKSLKNIGIAAFKECEDLENVYYAGTEAEWNAITIGGHNDAITNATKTYYAK